MAFFAIKKERSSSTVLEINKLAYITRYKISCEINRVVKILVSKV